MNQTLQAKRILVTQALDFMGPTLCAVLREHGGIVQASDESLVPLESAASVVRTAGMIDILVANLAMPAPTTLATDATEEEWRSAFASMVDPLPRLFKAILPSMVARKAGKIIVMGSASALKGMKRASTYSAARGAQLAYVQSVGVEVAQYNIQVNAVAQNFVDNPTYFPREVQENPKFQQRLAREVPLGRLVSAREDAEFVAYLCGESANCFVGQVFPLCGGWAVK